MLGRRTGIMVFCGLFIVAGVSHTVGSLARAETGSMYDAEIVVERVLSPVQLPRLPVPHSPVPVIPPPPVWASCFSVAGPDGNRLRSEFMFGADLAPDATLPYAPQREAVMEAFVFKLMRSGWKLAPTAGGGTAWYSFRLKFPGS